MAMFDRVCQLVVGQSGSRGVEINDLRIAFSINKTSGKKPNNSDVRVWNMKKSTRDSFELPRSRCNLYAGYREGGGLIKVFEGDVTFAWTKFDGPDIITQIELGEGVREIRDSAVSLSYGSTANSRGILSDIASRMGLGLDLASDAPSRTWSNGISFHGPARTALDRVTRASGLSWSIQAGSLQVIQAGSTTSRRAISLSAESGLVESPERQREGPQQASQVTDQAERRTRRVASATQGHDGWLVKSLLLPAIVPNDPVKLEARGVTGVFLAIEVRHIGDTHDGDFRTELKLVEPAVARRLEQQRNERGSTGRTARASAATPPVAASRPAMPIPPVPPPGVG